VLGFSSSFVDPGTGAYNVFATTSGGINHYEKAPGGAWGGEVIASSG
jgi:hypothetical protein